MIFKLTKLEGNYKMEKIPKKLSYESDGKMGKKKKDVNQKSQRDENGLFFNTTQNSE
jgi:hypothetical protein